MPTARQGKRRLNEKLFEAIRARDAILVSRLLRRGADPNTHFVSSIYDNLCGRYLINPTITEAILYECESCCAALLRFGADATRVSNNGSRTDEGVDRIVSRHLVQLLRRNQHERRAMGTTASEQSVPSVYGGVAPESPIWRVIDVGKKYGRLP